MKKKVLFINGHLNVGGVEKSLVDILKHIDYTKYDVDLLLLEGFGDYFNEIPKEVNIHLKSLGNTYGQFFKCIIKTMLKRDRFSLKMRIIFLLMKFFGQNKISYAKGLLTDNQQYDCVIGFRTGICSQIATYAVCANKRILWWHHGEFNVNAKEYEELVNNCDKIVTVSNNCASMIMEHTTILREKIEVVPNMIDVDLLEKKGLEYDPYNHDVLNIVTVCRISEEKHIENTIYSAKKLKEDGYTFKWHIVGDGFLLEAMKNLSEKYDVDDVVVFEGKKTNPYPYMKYADLYVHPSYVESQGLTILEAISLHTPCVVTKALGPCEFIKNHMNGVLVDQNYESLVKGIKEILDNKELYDRIKTNSKCVNEYLSKNIMNRIQKLIN